MGLPHNTSGSRDPIRITPLRGSKEIPTVNTNALPVGVGPTVNPKALVGITVVNAIIHWAPRGPCSALHDRGVKWAAPSLVVVLNLLTVCCTPRPPHHDHDDCTSEAPGARPDAQPSPPAHGKGVRRQRPSRVQALALHQYPCHQDPTICDVVRRNRGGSTGHQSLVSCSALAGEEPPCQE